MEAAMTKCLAATGTLVILAASLLVSGRADAGASASAPSKYGHTNQVATAYPASGKRQPRGSEYGITEYSSSSARPASPRHQDR
jgi:hypothetical protein